MSVHKSILPSTTVGLIAYICKRHRLSFEDLFSFAYIMQHQCKKTYTGDEKDFCSYLNRSILNKVTDNLRRKKVKIARIDKDIDDFGYIPASNAEVNDFRRFVKNSCSDKTQKFFQLYLDRPVTLVLSLRKNNLSGSGEVSGIFDYMGCSERQRRSVVKELKNARAEYKKY